MQMHTGENRAGRSRSVAHEVAHPVRGGEDTFQFVDNRTEVGRVKHLQELARGSAATLQLKSWQELANNSAVSRKVMRGHQAGSAVSHLPEVHDQAAERHPGGTEIVQRKKTVQPPLGEFPAKLRQTERGSVGNSGTDVEKGNAIWQHLNAVYEDSRTNGARYWDGLNARIEEYKNDKSGYIQRMQAIRAEYDRRYAAHYVTKPAKTKDHIQTAGVLEKNEDTKPDFNQYNNEMDTDQGSIIAHWVYATSDPARISDDENARTPGYVKKGLPNSEVLWKQYFEVAKSKFWVLKESRAKAAMQNLNRIIQDKISNIESIQAAYMALPDGQGLNTAFTWLPGNRNDFLAVLGTPNARSAAFMLGDHLDETGGKTIKHIRATGEATENLNNVNFDIEFVQIPEALAAMEAEAEEQAAEEALQGLLMLLVAISYGEME